MSCSARSNGCFHRPSACRERAWPKRCRLLEGTEFTFADRTAVGAAVASYERGKADFSDYLIGATAASAGASTTFTFDRGLRKSEDFTLVPSR